MEITPHPHPLPASGAREKRNGRCVGWPLPSGRDEEGVIAKSERDEAIHSCLAAMDCFACARNDGFNGLRLAVGTRVSHFWVNCGRRDAYTAAASPVFIPPTSWGGWRIVSAANDVTGGVVYASQIFSRICMRGPTRRFAPPLSELRSSRPHKVGGIRTSEMSLRGANLRKHSNLPVGASGVRRMRAQ